jgi:excisionase family DNA binding protein
MMGSQHRPAGTVKNSEKSLKVFPSHPQKPVKISKKTVKNISKNRSGVESHSVSEAAAILGVSVPTCKRMVTEGGLEAYRTPGSHLRILTESIESMREGRRTRPRSVRDASPVLQNRRERLEELTLEAQEHRAQRELDKLHAEDQEEVDSREAEAEAREQEAAQRQAGIELERERLEFEKSQEQARRKEQQAREQAQREAEWELAMFRSRWMDQANEVVLGSDFRWLSAAQRKEVQDGLEAEIEKRQPIDEPRMPFIIVLTLNALVQPFRAERDAQERRQKLTSEALWRLPWSATEAERVKATAAIRDALARFDCSANESEMRIAAQEAVLPFRQGIEKRQLEAKLLDWAIRELPWHRTDRDIARIRRECSEILADLPLDVTEAEGKDSLEPTVREASEDIKQRQAEKERQSRKANLIQQGVAEVSSYLLELKRDQEITADVYWDSQLKADLEEAVRRSLGSDLSGDETAKEVREMARKIIDAELE